MAQLNADTLLANLNNNTEGVIKNRKISRAELNERFKKMGCNSTRAQRREIAKTLEVGVNELGLDVVQIKIGQEETLNKLLSQLDQLEVRAQALSDSSAAAVIGSSTPFVPEGSGLSGIKVPAPNASLVPLHQTSVNGSGHDSVHGLEDGLVQTSDAAAVVEGSKDSAPTSGNGSNEAAVLPLHQTSVNGSGHDSVHGLEDGLVQTSDAAAVVEGSKDSAPTSGNGSNEAAVLPLPQTPGNDSDAGLFSEVEALNIPTASEQVYQLQLAFDQKLNEARQLFGNRFAQAHQLYTESMSEAHRKLSEGLGEASDSLFGANNQNIEAFKGRTLAIIVDQEQQIVGLNDRVVQMGDEIGRLSEENHGLNKNLADAEKANEVFDGVAVKAMNLLKAEQTLNNQLKSDNAALALELEAARSTIAELRRELALKTQSLPVPQQQNGQQYWDIVRREQQKGAFTGHEDGQDAEFRNTPRSDRATELYSILQQLTPKKSGSGKSAEK